jgi:hypothetical protein
MAYKPQPLTSFRITIAPARRWPGVDGVGTPATQLVARDLTPINRMATLDVHAATLDYDQATRLRNWLNDWLGQHGNPANKITLG